MLFFTTGNEKEKTYILSAKEAFEKFSDMVWRLALSKTGKRELADDILQDVFMKYLSKSPKFYDENHCKAWLLRVTINCANDLFKSGWFSKKAELTENIADEQEFYSDVYSQVLKLPEKYRIVVHLHYYEGYSVKEISEILKRNQSTIKTRLFRAREQLQQLLKGEDFYV